jgi:DNA-directed RNA polymerase alpha subunit
MKSSDGDKKTEKSSEEAVEKAEENEVNLSDLGIKQEYFEALENAGLTMVSQLKGLSAEDLQYIEGLGEEGAEEVFEAVKKA